MTTYIKAKWKLKAELLFMSPFVWLGKIYGKCKPLKYPVDIFFFFPNADIGGSPKVNLDIVDCIKSEKRCLIIFSKKPKNNLFADRFKALNVPLIDLHVKIDNKRLHFVNFFYRGVIASWVKAQRKPILFGGECIYFYKVIPHVPRYVKTIELVHLASWINYTIAFAPFIDIRLFSTMNLLREVKDVYNKTGVPTNYEDHFRFIDNTIDIPQNEVVESEILQVIFVGRGSPQKRPELIAQIAKVLHESKAPVHFSFIGDVDLIFDPQLYPYCTFYGNIKKEEELLDIYAKSDVLLLTSAFEGLPIVVMQMMAYGKIVVSTAVGGIPDYISDGENGFLIHDTDEKAVVNKGVKIIKEIMADKTLKKSMGERNKMKAIQLFGKEAFNLNYKKLINE